MIMRLTTRSCRLGGIISGRMKQWRLSGSTAGCATGLPAFGDGPALCRKRLRWSTLPSHCLPPTTSIEQRQNSLCHYLLNTLLEIEREIGLAEADGGPHGFDAAGGDAIEAGCSDLGDQAVSAQLGDQPGGLVGSASGLAVIRGRGVEELGLEVAVAEAGDGESAGQHGAEQPDGGRLDRIEARHPGCAVGPAPA